MAYATLMVPGLAPYRITDEDRLWAGRAAQFEGGLDPADVLWTWTQRYALPAYRRAFPSLKALIQAHSQPVNPIWRRDGSKCRPGGPYYGRDQCSAARLATRDRAATIPFSALDADVRAKVDAWAKGQLANPVPRSVDFANAPVSQAFISRNPGSEVLKRAGNWFIGVPQSLSWPDNYVQLVPISAKDAMQIVVPVAGGIAVAAAAGFAFWAWWRSR